MPPISAPIELDSDVSDDEGAAAYNGPCLPGTSNEDDGGLQHRLLDDLPDPTPAIRPLPEFINDVQLAELSPELERILVMSLDRVSIGESLLNWKDLASLLGMSPDEISYLAERAAYPSSPTAELLFIYRHRCTLGHLLQLIRDRLHRYDVILRLLPSLERFERELLLRKQPKKVSNLSSTTSINSFDSGCFRDESITESRSSNLKSTDSTNEYSPNANGGIPFRSRLRQTTNGANGRSSESSLNQFTACSYMGGDRSPRSIALFQPSNQHCLDEAANDDLPSASSSCFRSPNGVASKPSVLVVFYPDDEQHVKYLRWLCKNIRKHAGCVRIDQIDSAYSDVAGGVVDVFANASQVVVVASDGLKRAIGGDDINPIIDDAHRCRYAYKLMESEYVRNGCRNCRFRTIVFPFSDANTVLPNGFLRNITLYHWPDQQEQLFHSMFSNWGIADRYPVDDSSSVHNLK